MNAAKYSLNVLYKYLLYIEIKAKYAVFYAPKVTIRDFINILLSVH